MNCKLNEGSKGVGVALAEEEEAGKVGGGQGARGRRKRECAQSEVAKVAGKRCTMAPDPSSWLCGLVG